MQSVVQSLRAWWNDGHDTGMAHQNFTGFGRTSVFVLHIGVMLLVCFIWWIFAVISVFLSCPLISGSVLKFSSFCGFCGVILKLTPELDTFPAFAYNIGHHSA